MYMRDTMHQIDSGVIISFLKAILRKFRECVEIPLGLGAAAAKKLTERLRMLLGKKRSASGHLLHGAHACLVPVNYASANIFRQLQDKKKGARNTRATDYRHLLLLLPFILSNLFREEVEEHNRKHRAHVVDPSEELIGVANIFLQWYKLFRETSPGKTPEAISTLRSLSHRYMNIIGIIVIIVIIEFIVIIVIIVLIVLRVRLLGLFKSVFPYRNGAGRLVMDTEKVHSIKHCHIDVTSYSNPINCCCDGPEGGHKTWVHQQGLKTNQSATAAKTLMTHSLNKEASQLLCDAVRCRVEDGDATAEDWTDSNGDSLPADRYWNDRSGVSIVADDSGSCMGIELNIWERAKV
jgi:hypothetical protein